MGNKKSINKYWFMLAGLLLLVVIIVVPIVLSMRGEVKTTGQWSSETSESLTCKAKNINYEYFGDDAATSSNNVQVNAIFNDGRISSIDLNRKMTYIDADTAKTWSDAHEFNVNKKFGEDGLKPYALNANFSVNGNTAQMNLYATNGEINNITIKYFMLDNMPKDIDGYKTAYSSKGFACDMIK
ncbi:MAG: hypothetical protein Q4A36_03875 [Candidatus Saccharibacteria bacterium]|nr:hypothetical protein [Candidatus Saccharibacteria bacterium]